MICFNLVSVSRFVLNHFLKPRTPYISKILFFINSENVSGIIIFSLIQDPQFHLEAKLRKQQMESEVDSRWLQQEENNLVNFSNAFQNFKLTHFILRAEKPAQSNNKRRTVRHGSIAVVR